MKHEKAAGAVGLTAKQLACLDAVEAHHARTNSMPSLDQLRSALGLTSKSGAARLLSQLEQRGAIRRLAGRARAIRVLRQDACPHCGKPVETAPTRRVSQGALT
jgi:SOS-response transcriptional repressor LexA